MCTPEGQSIDAKMERHESRIIDGDQPPPQRQAAGRRRAGTYQLHGVRRASIVSQDFPTVSSATRLCICSRAFFHAFSRLRRACIT